jgi:lysophospholipase L1-like esterase
MSRPFIASLGAAMRSSVRDLSRGHALGRRVVAVYKAAAILVLNALICFGCLELVATGLIRVSASLGERDAGDTDPRSKSSYFASQGWARQYWQEFSPSRRQTYRPFVLWRRGAYVGETINVDDFGVRLTPGARCIADSLKVFVLGGSTVWGTGSPDWGTLPAYLQTELQHDTARPLCVVNYGESAYVSTQSIVQLIVQLQAGNVPDIVVSYEGPNDAYSAYQSGRAGVHENLDEVIASFEGRRTAEGSAIARFMRSTSLFAATAALLMRVTHASEAPAEVETYETKGVDKDTLSAGVAKIYLGNYDIVDGLARKYGFDFWFFWPPYIRMGHKVLVAEEQAIARGVDSSLDALYQSAHKAVAAEAWTRPQLRDLTDAFDDYPDLVWIDDMHVTPEGNRVLAARIAAVLRAGQRKGVRNPVDK